MWNDSAADCITDVQCTRRFDGFSSFGYSTLGLRFVVTFRELQTFTLGGSPPSIHRCHTDTLLLWDWPKTHTGLLQLLISMDECSSQAVETFKLLDRDRSGSISRAELLQFIADSVSPELDPDKSRLFAMVIIS